MSGRAAHTVLSPYNIHVPFFPPAPSYLRKQYRVGGLVSFEQAEKYMADYNRWATRWNEQERAFQAHKSNIDPMQLDCPDGKHQLCMSPRTCWDWLPTEGPWVRAERNGLVREYPLTLVARVKGYRSRFYPRQEVTPELIVWAAWVNFWHDGRVPS